MSRKTRQHGRRQYQQPTRKLFTAAPDSAVFLSGALFSGEIREVVCTLAPQSYIQHARSQFKNAKHAWLESLDCGLYPELINRMGLSRIRGGHTPSGLSTHHLLPLYLGGANYPDNFVLMRIREHEMLHQQFIAPQTLDMRPRVPKRILLPWGDGFMRYGHAA